MLPRNATHCLHTLHLDVFTDTWFVNYIHSKFEIMAPNSQALKSVRIKNWKIVPFNSFCHPALIAWKWNKIIYGCDCQSVVFFGPTVRWDNALFWFSKAQHALIWAMAVLPAPHAIPQLVLGQSPLHATAQFDQPLEKFSYSAIEFSPLSLSLRSLTLSLSLYGQCLACPFSVPEPKQRSWP